MSRDGRGYRACLDLLAVEYRSDRSRNERGVHDGAVDHCILRQRLQAEAHQFIPLLGTLQFDGLDRARTDVESHDWFLFSRTEHRTAFLRALQRRPSRLAPSALRLAHFFFHPAVEHRFTEFPPAPELTGLTQARTDVAIKRIGRKPQMLRSFAQVHHFSRFTHSHSLRLKPNRS